jgi:hypothetical protein
MQSDRAGEPDSTAVRKALWRAMHVQVDPPPYVFEDEVGLRLADPPEGWRSRPIWVCSCGPFAPPSWPALAS